MKPRAPLVSVIIPTFNRSAYLGATIESVLDQDHPNVEVIVVNDGSTDGTATVLRSYGERIIRIDQPNSGQGSAVNAGLAASHGEYATLVSDDDPLLPGALSRLVDALETDLGALVAYPDWNLIASDGERTGVITSFEYSLPDMLRHHLCYPGPCSLFRRRALELVGGWDTRWRWVADFDFWLRIGLHGRMLRVPEVLATWRRHAETATHTASRLAMAREQVGVIEAFFARTDLPPEVRSVEREAMASAYAIGSLFALEELASAGVPRFQVIDRLAQYIEHPVSARTPGNQREPQTTAMRLAALEEEVRILERDRETLRRHVEVLERHIVRLGGSAPEARRT